MLKMDQYELVRTAHRVYGKNISEISRTTGHSRNTIKKALRGEGCGYKERQHQAFPALEPYLEVINRWLKEDKVNNKKQRHTSRRIYNRLLNEYGFKGGESTVRRYVKMARAKMGLECAKAFIPCDPEAGYEAEVDWGTANAVIACKEMRLKFFCMRSKYSGKHFVRFYQCERQQAFFDGHIQAFEFFGGIFPIIIYDNLTTAVQKVLKGKGRIEQEGFVKFRAYYNFEAHFCTPGEGHEKGGVEGMVGYVRRNYMVPIPQAKSIEELNEKILKECIRYGEHRISGREKKVCELFEEEKSHLISMPDNPYSNIQTYDGEVDKYSTVIIDKNRYSVPTQYVGYKIKTLLFVNRVEIFWGNKRVAVHERMFDVNKWGLNPQHYLDLIEQRPMSFNSARPIRQWKEKWSESLELILEKFCQSQGSTKGIKDFISVLKLYKDYEICDVEAAVELAIQSNISSSEGVKHILIYTGESKQDSVRLENWQTFSPPDVAEYAQLGGVI
jgi:transposase